MTDKLNTQGMLDTYLFECEQLLEQIQKTILEQKDKDGFEEESIHEIFRAMHTIKGISGMMMFDEITKISHKLEDVFFYMRESMGETEMTKSEEDEVILKECASKSIRKYENKQVSHMELMEHVLSVTDFINGELTKITNGEAVDGKADNYMKKLDQLLEKMKKEENKEGKTIEENIYVEPQQFYIPPKVTGVSSFYKIHLTFRPGLDMANVHAYKIIHALKEIAEDMIYEPEDIISDDNAAEDILKKGFDILLQTQKKEEDLHKILKTGYAITKVEIISGNAREYCKGFEENKEYFEKESDEVKTLERTYVPGDFVIESKEPGKGKKLAKDRMERASYIRVDVKKMDILMQLLEELNVSQTAVLTNSDLRVPGLSLANFDKAAEQMMNASAKLQNAILSMRMMNLNHTFQRMNRIVFETARQLGKEIDLEMIGEDTELDKNIVEHILAPLMHIVRNSVDHGIEMPQEREKLGKGKRGKITLTAGTQGGKVWICVEDDGKGLNKEKILQKAQKQGLLNAEETGQNYTDKEIYQFITLPGFSTKEEITEYSGRGVGMDVVVSNLQEINGTLEIESTEGVGTKMIMYIPTALNRRI